MRNKQPDQGIALSAGSGLHIRPSGPPSSQNQKSDREVHAVRAIESAFEQVPTIDIDALWEGHYPSDDDPHETKTYRELADAIHTVVSCAQRIEHERQMEAHANELAADAQRHIEQATDARDQVLSSLSTEARELFAKAGGAWIGDDLWIWVGTTKVGVPVLRKIEPIELD